MVIKYRPYVNIGCFSKHVLTMSTFAWGSRRANFKLRHYLTGSSIALASNECYRIVI